MLGIERCPFAVFTAKTLHPLNVQQNVKYRSNYILQNRPLCIFSLSRKVITNSLFNIIRSIKENKTFGLPKCPFSQTQLIIFCFQFRNISRTYYSAACTLVKAIF